MGAGVAHQERRGSEQELPHFIGKGRERRPKLSTPMRPKALRRRGETLGHACGEVEQLDQFFALRNLDFTTASPAAGASEPSE